MSIRIVLSTRLRFEIGAEIGMGVQVVPALKLTIGPSKSVTTTALQASAKMVEPKRAGLGRGPGSVQAPEMGSKAKMPRVRLCRR